MGNMKILMLGGGHQQLQAIRKAKGMGLEVIVADYLEHPPGMDEADRFYWISTRDREEILALARQEDVDGILSYASDPAAETAAYVAGQLGLPGGYVEAAEILGHKGRFRQFLLEHQIPVPEHTYLTGWMKGDESLHECQQCACKTGETDCIVDGLAAQSILIKPADSSGSKGVTVLHTPDQIKLFEAYQKALSFAFRGDVLAEEYIPYGYRNLIGGDVIVRNGEIVCLGLMDCVREQDHPLVPCGKIWPCGADETIRDRIAEIITLTAHELHVSDAEMNVEFIVRDDGTVYPIEIALRCGGNGIPQLLSDATGVDWIREEVLRTLRGGQQKDWNAPGEKNAVQQEENHSVGGIYATYNLHANTNGLYAGYELAEELAAHLYREELFCCVGDEAKPYTDASGIIGILYFRFDSREEAERYLFHMQQYLQIHLITIERALRVSDLAANEQTARTDSSPSSPVGSKVASHRMPVAFPATSLMLKEYPAAYENLHDAILRLGEHMTPPFSQRDRNGWKAADYADKLIGNAEIFTARHSSGETVGLIAAYMNQQDSAFISMLVVSPQYRRCRIANTLCRYVHELARQRGIHCVRGKIRRDNAACRAMAEERLGYILIDIEGSDFVKAELAL